MTNWIQVGQKKINLDQVRYVQLDAIGQVNVHYGGEDILELTGEESAALWAAVLVRNDADARNRTNA